MSPTEKDRSGLLHQAVITRTDRPNVMGQSLTLPLPEGGGKGVTFEAGEEMYRIVDDLGRGGCGNVWLVTDGSDRPFAAKFINLSVYHRGDIDRWVTELRALHQLWHPRIAGLHDIAFDPSDRMYLHGPLPLSSIALIQEYAGRLSLDSLLENDQFGEVTEIDGVSALSHQTASAVEFMHRSGFLHGDIRPENIMFNRNKGFKLVDFGAAMMADAENRYSDSGVLHMAYAAPERFEKREFITPASDVFSLGLTLARACFDFGQATLDSGPSSRQHTIMRIVENSELRLVPCDLPFNQCETGKLRDIFRKACAFNPRDRYQSVAEMYEDLRRVKPLGLPDRLEL